MNEAHVLEFMELRVVKRLIGQVTSVVELAFPGVADRFRHSVDWHYKRYGIRPMFGLFWNFCINGILLGQKRIHCRPHSDSKNIVGVCALVIYQLPGSRFDNTRKSWIVLWEAGVAIQLPPWVIFAYPSSLLYHFNIDVDDFKFVTMVDGETPTPENSLPLEQGGDEGRGSIVFFNQASMYAALESGWDTLYDAREAGHSGTSDYGRTVAGSFESYGRFIDAREGRSPST
ncbi:unnamed protein product [Cyclocybe aegerita]|uniref:Uncharacterized protein n=1 Tax=Cyclocybe aegerita TaxID=1973307 RepID=A0A8S0XTP5_CYCAE|nr:unnamed protein product [Cyclocybe aegerita]